MKDLCQDITGFLTKIVQGRRRQYLTTTFLARGPWLY